jgi:hypothetical protein
MSFLQNPRTFGRAIQRKQSDDFARMRSRYVDMFSAAELRLSKLYINLGLSKSENASTGHKIGELKLLKPCSAFSKAKITQIRDICRIFAKQINIRNGLAHAEMLVGTRAGEDVAFFQKTNDAAASNPIYLVMSFDDFSMAIDAINELTRHLDAILTPPSSPPQPSRGVTNGP